jgi:predicted phosphodiesterase
MKELAKERTRADRMADRMQQMIDNQQVEVAEYFGTSAKIGFVTDTHFGSLWERPKLLEAAYQIMHQEGIKTVFHGGDVLEGSGMRKGHEHEVAVVGCDAQVAHARDVYPHIKGMTTYFILGSHDLSFHKSAGSSPGPRIADGRDDLRQLGNAQYADVPLKVGGTVLHVAIEHPGGGSSYALSYKSQKQIEALAGGRKPHILLIGHYHKAEYLPNYRNVAAIQGGCFQSQTDWMRSKGLAAHLGFWMLEIRATKVGLARLNAEFTPFFETI